VPFSDLIQKYVPGSVQVLIQVDKSMVLFQNSLTGIQKLLLFRVLMIYESMARLEGKTRADFFNLVK
jgi:hypothetical protein